MNERRQFRFPSSAPPHEAHARTPLGSIAVDRLGGSGASGDLLHGRLVIHRLLDRNFEGAKYRGRGY